MNNLTNWETLYQRKNIRIETKGGIAMTPNGVCRITNLSKEGCALKCLNAWGLPSEWTMDLYDETGLNLKELKVRKIWTTKPSNPKNFLYSEVEVGGVFEDLSLSQEAQLYGHLLELIAVEKKI